MKRYIHKTKWAVLWFNGNYTYHDTHEEALEIVGSCYHAIGIRAPIYHKEYFLS